MAYKRKYNEEKTFRTQNMKSTIMSIGIRKTDRSNLRAALSMVPRGLLQLIITAILEVGLTTISIIEMKIFQK